jgi:hypothetical protein
MLMVSSYPSFASRLTQTVIAAALFSSVLWMTTADAGPLSIALPGERALPESIISARDRTLRLGDGGIIRANPRTGKASLFVALGASGSRSITGVFADQASKTQWACSNDLSALGGPSGGRDRGSALKRFDLQRHWHSTRGEGEAVQPDCHGGTLLVQGPQTAQQPLLTHPAP